MSYGRVHPVVRLKALPFRVVEPGVRPCADDREDHRRDQAFQSP